MNIYTIYKATNIINQKSYVGFATNFENRKIEHKKRYIVGDNYFYRAIKKYGWDNFCWEILYQSLDKNHTKNIMENYFIIEYRTYINFKDCAGYNMTLGGDGSHGFLHSEKSKQRMSISRKGKVVGVKKVVSCKLYNPEGKLIEIQNLREFCVENGFRYESMLGIIKSTNIKQNFGWMKYVEGESYKETLDNFYKSKTKYKLWRFYKNGTYEETYNLYKYSEENSLNYKSMKDIFRNHTYVYNNHLTYIEGMSFEERTLQIKTEKETNEFIRRSKITGRPKKGIC